MRKYKNDILLILGLLIISILGLVLYFTLQTNKNLKVYIYYEKSLVEEIDISENRELQVNDVIIIIKDKEVYVSYSSCRDQVCVHQGKIKSAGQTITCLPQRVLIQIEGSEVDVGI